MEARKMTNRLTSYEKLEKIEEHIVDLQQALEMTSQIIELVRADRDRLQQKVAELEARVITIASVARDNAADVASMGDLLEIVKAENEQLKAQLGEWEDVPEGEYDDTYGDGMKISRHDGIQSIKIFVAEHGHGPVWDMPPTWRIQRRKEAGK
jgi:phosphoribosyl-ATP pyrophosphohydrolase